jgi:hypothetical protein
MKSFIKISIYALAIIGLALTIIPPNLLPSFLDVRYMGLAMLAEAALINFLPRVLMVPAAGADTTLKNEAVESFQFLMALTFAANGLGDIGLYQLYTTGFEFDKILHFSIPIIGVFIISLLFYNRFELTRSRALIITILIVAALALGWEAFEYIMDHYFSTRLHGINGVNSAYDTQIDLILGAAGIICGSIITLLKLKPPIKARPRLQYKKQILSA